MYITSGIRNVVWNANALLRSAEHTLIDVEHSIASHAGTPWTREGSMELVGTLAGARTHYNLAAQNVFGGLAPKLHSETATGLITALSGLNEEWGSVSGSLIEPTAVFDEARFPVLMTDLKAAVASARQTMQELTAAVD